jgi:2-polyprenyl-3-methyl-5-hydroxy-6-metoxy-1,4-benzoquinol methylase
MNQHLVDGDVTLRSVVRGLRAGGEISDPTFDRIYPDWAQRLSEVHWTPVEVARRAAKLLTVHSRNRILDIGSGVGKFCLIGALTTRATFVGIEQRGNLVDVARSTAERCGASRAQFLHGNMMDLDWRQFDGFYLYNPFYEHVAECLTPIVGDIDRAPEHYKTYVDATCARLMSACAGTRVVMYHGFGGIIPEGYDLIGREPAGTDYLDVWEKGALP